MKADTTEKKIDVQYYALLREERGLSFETVMTIAQTPKELYGELQKRHGFRLPIERLKVAVNDAFQDWDSPLQPNDNVVFIPPVAGG